MLTATAPTTAKKLHLGCGNHIFPGWVNLDMFPLPGVDVVHDLRIQPWPFPDNTFDEIYMHQVLEHLPDTVGSMHELWRILKPGGVATVRVPFWNSFHAFRDPTHFRTFHTQSFDFYDLDTAIGKNTSYYTQARFKILQKDFFVSSRWGDDERGWYRVSQPALKWFIEKLATHLCGIIYFIEVKLQARKENPG